MASDLLMIFGYNKNKEVDYQIGSERVLKTTRCFRLDVVSEIDVYVTELMEKSGSVSAL